MRHATGRMLNHYARFSRADPLAFVADDVWLTALACALRRFAPVIDLILHAHTGQDLVKLAPGYCVELRRRPSKLLHDSVPQQG